jgi:type II secretory pathway pseudopilin PulG
MVHRTRQTIGKLALADATRHILPHWGPPRNRCRRAGFTLIEAVISTVIVAVMFVAALNTVGAARVAQYKAALVGRGRMYAEALMTEILQQSYQEPGATYVFGREAGESETIRTAYDDVDDYHGWTESPLAAQDGTALPNSANWSRTVTSNGSILWTPKIRGMSGAGK